MRTPVVKNSRKRVLTIWLSLGVILAAFVLAEYVMHRAYGPVLVTRSAVRAWEFVTDNTTLFLISTAVSAVIPVILLSTTERRKEIRNYLQGAAIWTVSMTCVFHYLMLFETPYRLYDEEKARASGLAAQLQSAHEELDRLRAAVPKPEATPASESASELAARQDHLGRLREVLVNEAQELKRRAENMRDWGHVVGIRGENLLADEDRVWTTNVLVQDFSNHFSEYARNRSQLRRDVAAHDQRFRELVSYAARNLRA